MEEDSLLVGSLIDWIKTSANCDGSSWTVGWWCDKNPTGFSEDIS